MRMYLGAHHDKVGCPLEKPHFGSKVSFQINKNSMIGKAYMPWREEYEIKKRDLNKYLNDYRHPIYPQVKAALEEWIAEILQE